MSAPALVLAGREVRGAVRAPAVLFGAIALPLLLMVLMTLAFADVVAPGAGYAAYVDHTLPLFLVMGLAFAALSSGATTFADLRSGFDTRLRSLPVGAAAPIVGRVLGDLVRNGATVAVVVGVGAALGFRFTTGPVAVLGFVLLALAAGAALTVAMMAIAVRAADGEAAGAAMNAVLLVLSFLSTGFVPLVDLPGWAQPIAAVNPISVLVAALRVLAHGGPLLGPLAAALGWVLVLGGIGGWLAVRGHRRARG